MVCWCNHVILPCFYKSFSSFIITSFMGLVSECSVSQVLGCTRWEVEPRSLLCQKVKVTWHTAKYGDPYSEFVPIQSAHTQRWTHTHTPWTHTRSSGQPFYAAAPGEQLGSGALLKGTSVVVLKVERVLYIHPPPPPTIPAGPILEPATFGLRAQLSNH